MTLPAPNQAELWEELRVDSGWFHVVRSMIMGDKIAEMGVNAWGVYCVLKAYTKLDTGRTWPSQETIGKHLGLSVDTVARATDRLIELGIVEKSKVGRRNEYSLVEAVPLRNREDDIVAVGSDIYRPMGFKSFLAELKQFARTGAVDPDSQVNITFNITLIQQGDNGVVNVQNVSAGADYPQKPAVSKVPPQVYELARRLKRLDD